MGTDMSSLIRDYASSTGMSEQEIVDRLKGIGQSLDLNDNSVFAFDSSQDDFVNLMCERANKSNDDSFREDVVLLFNILNTDGDSKLSEKELEMFKRGSGAQMGEVTAFSFWNALGSLHTANGGSGTSGSGSDGSGSGGTSGSGETGGSTGLASKDHYDYTKSSDAKLFLDGFIDSDMQTYGEVIDWLLATGTITQEEASQLRTSVCKASYTQEQQGQIDRLVAAGKTEEEAIEILKAQGKLPADNSDELNKVRTRISDDQASAIADQLYESMHGLGTDEDLLESIIFDDSLSDEDFAKVVAMFNQKYGSQATGEGLVTWIENDTSFGLQTKLTQKLGERLANAANNGDSVAIEQLARELYSGTAGQNCTADDFLAGVFANIKDDALYKVNSMYGTINNGHTLTTDIKNDHAGLFGWRTWFTGTNASGNGQSYIDRINKCVRNH